MLPSGVSARIGKSADMTVSSVTKGKKVALFAVHGGLHPDLLGQAPAGLQGEGGRDARQGRRRHRLDAIVNDVGDVMHLEAAIRRWARTSSCFSDRRRRVHQGARSRLRCSAHGRCARTRYSMIVEDGVVEAAQRRGARGRSSIR